MATDFERTVKTMEPTSMKLIGEGRFHAHLVTYANGWKAITKKDVQGGVFRQLPTSEAHLREEAFFHLGELLYPGVVPETYVITLKGAQCSAQKWVPGFHLREYDEDLFDHEKEDFLLNLHNVSFKAAPKEAWKRLTMLDLVGNSRDRHGKNILIRPKNVIPFAAIDNGFSLGKTFRSYRNVFHRYLFYYHYFAPSLLKDIEKLTLKDVTGAICPLLKPVYAEHVIRRRDWILEFPHRLPWRVISRGTERAIDFPSYETYFRKDYRKLPQRPLVVKAA